jgi:hypothetical protein
MSNKTRYFVVVSAAILAVGLGTGLVASYLGLPVSVFSSAAGPDELQYVPADAAVVAYANVRDVMNSEFRQRFREMEPTSAERNQFEEQTGINIETDIDSVVAAMMPGAVSGSGKGALVLARGRFQTSRLEALAIEHGAAVEDYDGKRIITHDGGGNGPANGKLALGFIEADLVAVGSDAAVRGAIDARRDNRNVVSNNELMRLVAELDASNVWAVGRFDALAKEANLPGDIAVKIPSIAWFSAAGHINGGLSGVFKAETKDDESAQNLRDVLRGFLALAKMQAVDKPGMREMVESLQLSGEGKTVALAFSVPTEVLDVIEALGKAHKSGLEQKH